MRNSTWRASPASEEAFRRLLNAAGDIRTVERALVEARRRHARTPTVDEVLAVIRETK